MNGVQLTEYTMVPTLFEARLIRELNQYCVMPSQCHDGSNNGYCVYYWYAAIKQFHYIGRRATYHEADHLIRAHTRRRLRRRSKHCSPPVLRLCFTCGIRRRYPDAYGDCYTCFADVLAAPDDDPGFDPLFLM